MTCPSTLNHNVNTSPNNRELQTFESIRDNEHIRMLRSQYYTNPDQWNAFDEHSQILRSAISKALSSYKNLIVCNAPHYGVRITDAIDAIHTAYKDSHRALMHRYRSNIDATFAFPAIVIPHTMHMNSEQCMRYAPKVI